MRYRLFGDLCLFGKAYRATRHEIRASLKILAVVTIVFAAALFFAERLSNRDYTFWDALVWTFVKYVEDPADIVLPPVTVIGKIVGTLVGVLGIAIFAVPAGLIGSGMMDAMSEEKREKELIAYRQRMRKSFRRMVDKTLRGYLNSLPDGGGEAFRKLYFVPQRIPVARIQLRQGIDMKDIFDVCHQFPEFRLKNLAEAVSEENHPEDRFVVEHYPLNRSYGYAINRKSRVTIVSASSSAENGTGWFSYYLAKFGGFNFVSKDIEADSDELDSFYNLADKPVSDKQAANRKAFLNDLKEMVTTEDSWIILFTAHIKSSMNKVDFHFADAEKDGSDSTVIQQDNYKTLRQKLSEMLYTDYALESDLQSQRFPLTKNNLGYRLRQKGIVCNTFVLRPSCDIINFDNRRLLIAYRMATIISQQLDAGRGIQPDDVKDFKETEFGYKEIIYVD